MNTVPVCITALLCAGALQGCLLDFPDPQDGSFACLRQEDCLEGFSCVEGRCVAGTAAADAAAQRDAGPFVDASGSDGSPGGDGGIFDAPASDALDLDALAFDAESADALGSDASPSDGQASDVFASDGHGADALWSDGQAADLGSLVSDAIVADVPVADAQVSDALVSDALVADVLVSDALVSDALVSDALVSDALVSDAFATDGAPPAPDALPGDAPAPDAAPRDALPADALSSDAVPSDALPPDAPRPDAVALDAAPVDSGLRDALPPDAPAADATPLDLGPRDTGVIDTGTRDTGVLDVGVPDAGCAQTLCGVACVNLQNSPDHCGACNRSCGGGTCSAGRCQPFTWFEQNGARPGRIVHDEPTGHLYWTNDVVAGAIYRRIADRSAPVEAVALSQRKPAALAVDGAYVYWATVLDDGTKRGQVRYRDKQLSSADQLAWDMQLQVTGLAVSGGFVYSHSNSPLRIRGFEPPGTTREYSPSGGSSWVRSIAADATYVYWLDSLGEVFRHELALPAAPASIQIATGSRECIDSTVHGAHLYWSDAASAAGGSIFRIDRTSLIQETVVTAVSPTDTSAQARGFAVDGTHVYYAAARPLGGSGNVYRAGLTTGTPELLAPASLPTMTDLELAGDFIYWTEWDSSGNVGRIRALRKP